MSSYSFSENGLLLEALLVEQLRSQPVDFLGELGAFMDRPRLLLSSALGRVEALAVPFSMLLDVLVLGHLFYPALAPSRSPLSRCSSLLSQTHGERWLLKLTHVCDRCGDFLSALYVYETTRGT